MCHVMCYDQYFVINRNTEKESFNAEGYTKVPLKYEIIRSMNR